MRLSAGTDIYETSTFRFLAVDLSVSFEAPVSGDFVSSDASVLVSPLFADFCVPLLSRALTSFALSALVALPDSFRFVMSFSPPELLRLIAPASRPF